MKKLSLMIVAIAFFGFACANGATRIGNPPTLPEISQPVDGGSNGGAVEVVDMGAGLTKSMWMGSELSDSGLTIYVASFSDKEVTLETSDFAAPLSVEFERTLEGDVSALFDADSSLSISGKVEASSDGYEVALSIYKDGQLVSKLFKIISESVAVADILVPEALVMNGDLTCVDSDGYLHDDDQYEIAGKVVSGTSEAQKEYTDGCRFENTMLVEYSCKKSIEQNSRPTYTVVETQVQCSCASGKCVGDTKPVVQENTNETVDKISARTSTIDVIRNFR